MVATPTRIAFIIEPTRNVVNGPDAVFDAKYGDLARDTKDKPIFSYFASVDDAQQACDDRMALLSGDRRLIEMVVSGGDDSLRYVNRFPLIDSVDGFGLIDSTDGATLIGQPTNIDIPTVRVIDDERLADHLALVGAIEVDIEAEKTTIGTWG